MDYFVHKDAICETEEIGQGTRIWAFSHLLPGVKIGERCNVGEGVFIEGEVVVGNDCTIKNGVALWKGVKLEDGVFVGPCAVFTNDLRPRAFLKLQNSKLLPTVIQRGASVGANATIVCGITIGEYAMIGAGAVVTQDVAPHSLVVGNPSRILGQVCFCGERLSETWCPACQRPLKENSAALVIEKSNENHFSKGATRG